MPAKKASSKPKTSRAKSNVARPSTKTGLINKKVKFNWKIVAVIGIILVVALGYLYVRLSQAGGNVLSVNRFMTSGGAHQEKSNGTPIIRGNTQASTSINTVESSYYPPSNGSVRYRVQFHGSSNQSQQVIYVNACGYVYNTSAPVKNGDTLSIKVNRAMITSRCNGKLSPIQLGVGIADGFYITGVLAEITQTSPASTPTSQPSSAGGVCGGLNSFGQGNQGPCVKYIQQRLKNLGYNVGAVDGVYGSQTTSAVKVFQSRSGLKQDGVVGVQTWRALTNPNAARKQ